MFIKEFKALSVKILLLGLYLCFLLSAITVMATPPGNRIIKNQDLTNHWQIQSSSKINAGGAEISTYDFVPKDWYDATVPGTVLGSLVANSVFKNVFYGRNLEKIPESQFNVPWWYRTTFTIEKINEGQITKLRFNGISYRADIWLNGQKVASADSIKGSFRQFVLDISKYVKPGANVLALKITRAQKSDLTIGFVDWNPEPADHNMGIWRNVQLQISGPVSIDHPFVQTKVDTVTLDHADVTVSTVLHNYSDKVIDGELKGMIGREISFSQKVSIEPNSSKEVIFTPSQFSQLSINHPKLWWVHTLGDPHLYDLHLQFDSGDKISDSSHVRFGIRSVSDYITKEGHRGFRLNGKKILIKGGGWTDPMLLNATPAYERAGIDYAVHMNMNAIRMEGFWGNNQHIYNLCDEKGILIMVGFSCQWEWENLMGNKDDKYSAIMSPEQNDIAAESWHDQILWLRNHPSIFTWLYGSDKWPRPELEKRYLATLKDLDPTRPSVSSAKEVKSAITGPSAVKMRGPYDYVPPAYWYVDTAYGGAFGFNTETGPGPQIPVLESLKKMIPVDSLWPISSAWMYHAARGEFHNLTYYNNAMDNRLGKAKDLDDYLKKAQYLNYEGMRAMYEAFESNRFKATGIIQWMYNASWPKLWWQLYDYYLMPTGAFYGARKANEPLHISYNYGKDGVDIMNNTAEKTTGLSAEITVFDINMKQVFQKKIVSNTVGAQQTKPVFTLPANLNAGKTWFLDLRLYNKQRHLVSRNFYVLSAKKDKLNEKKSTWYVTPQTAFADLTLLQNLPNVKLERSETITTKGEDTHVNVKLKNPSTHLAFMIHLDMKKKGTGESVLPVFWNENYITLLPGEERLVSGYCHTSDLDKNQVSITVSGWNVKEQ
ncbi:MAG TPA: sugar-binding domain-containing protein [Hanamia sp.]